MSNRRALIAGIKPDEHIDIDLAERFIDGPKSRRAGKPAAPEPIAPQPAAKEAPPQPPVVKSYPVVPASQPSPMMGVGRTPVGARVRTDLATALKRASLERQLNGIQPCSVQDILEESIELWLLKHGHLK